MSKNYQSFLIDLIERSKLPSLLISDDNVITNSRLKELSLCTAAIKALISKYTFNDGGYEEINGNYYGVNVVRYATFTIIELYPQSPVEKLKRDAEIIKYLNCFFAKLRSEVYEIAEKTDALQEILSEYIKKYEDASVTLKCIDDDLNRIMSIILNPEQIVCLCSDYCREDIISLTKVCTELVRGFIACHPETDVGFAADDNLLTKINRRGFEVIISNFLERVYKEKYKPDSIDFVLNKVDENIKFQIKVDFSSQTPSNNVTCSEQDYADDFFFKYVLDIFCSKFNAKTCMVENTYFEISLPATPFYKLDFHTPTKFIPAPDRFAPIAVKAGKKSV